MLLVVVLQVIKALDSVIPLFADNFKAFGLEVDIPCNFCI